MPVDPIRIFNIIRELDATPNDELEKLDREMLLAIRETLSEHKKEVDRVLLRLAFVDEQRQLN